MMYQKFYSEYSFLCKSHKIDEYTKIIEDVVDAKSLITPWRLDFMAKLLLVESWTSLSNEKDTKELYEQHLIAFSGGTLVERGQKGKSGFQKYYEVFKSLCEDANKNSSIQVMDWPAIPLDTKGLPLDGAHRIMAAYHYRKKLNVYRIGISVPENYNYDYLFFRKRYLDEKYIIEMVKKYISIRECRLYVVDALSSAEIKKIYQNYHPVYIKRIGKKEVLIFDKEWNSRNQLENEFDISFIKEVFLLDHPNEILAWINANKDDLQRKSRYQKIGSSIGKTYQWARNVMYIYRDIILKRNPS